MIYKELNKFESFNECFEVFNQSYHVYIYDEGEISLSNCKRKTTVYLTLNEWFYSTNIPDLFFESIIYILTLRFELIKI